MLKRIKKFITIVLSVIMVIIVSSTGAAFASDLDSGHVPGQLKAVLKDNVRITKEELANPEKVFPGIQVLKITDLTDVSAMLPPGVEPKPYNGPQSLLLELADKNDAYLWEALSILEKDPRVAWAGPNGTTSINVPDEITPNMSRPVISVGAFHTLAVKSDDSLWAWGKNNYGELGDGCMVWTRLAPDLAMNNVLSAFAANCTSLMVKDDGTLWTWGLNNYGQLGDGTTINRKIPVQIMDNVVSASMNNDHGMAIKTDKSLWAWGNNGAGQLGDGTYTFRPTPVKVMDNVVSVSVGRYQILAITSDGNLWFWGNCIFGSSNTPVLLMGDVAHAAVDYNHLMIVKTDGSLWACGSNDYYALGYYGYSSLTPVKIMDDVIQVGVGENYTHAIKSDGSLWAWGRNDYGQLGDGTKTSRSSPVKIMSDSVVDVIVGRYHCLAFKADGSLWSWGRNDFGQAGVGTTTNVYTPTQIMAAGSISP